MSHYELYMNYINLPNMQRYAKHCEHIRLIDSKTFVEDIRSYSTTFQDIPKTEVIQASWRCNSIQEVPSTEPSKIHRTSFNSSWDSMALSGLPTSNVTTKHDIHLSLKDVSRSSLKQAGKVQLATVAMEGLMLWKAHPRMKAQTSYAAVNSQSIQRHASMPGTQQNTAYYTIN